MGVKYIGDQGPDGTSLGVTTSDLISVYGKTPIAQRSGSTQAAVAVSTLTTASQTTTPYGFATSTQADNLTATVAAQTVLLNEIRTALVNFGIIKGSA